MSGFVLDASVTLAWCFPDEATPETEALLDRARIGPVQVPALWPLEVGNILLSAQRRGRITPVEVARFVSILTRLRVAIDDQTGQRGFREILSTAQLESLTTYDASYLELALRTSLPLATRDRALAAAARRVGVEIML